MNQSVNIKWQRRTKRMYEELGYEFTNYSDLFTIKLSDLPINSNERVKVFCDHCGKEQITPYRNYNRIVPKSGEYRCRKCNAPYTSMIRIDRNKEKKVEDFKRLVEKIGCVTNVTSDDYAGCDIPMPIICPEHGKQMISLSQLKVGCVCPECGKSNKGKSFALTPDEVAAVVSSRNNAVLLNPEEYINCKDRNLKIKCGTCGNVFVTSYNCIKFGTGRCERCRRGASEGEYRIAMFLDDVGIGYERQKCFPECRNINSLPFDFYLPDYNCCIEFDGIQHFMPTRGLGEDALEKRKMLDGVKTEFCVNSDIRLIRIPYYSFNKIEEILSKELKIGYELEDIV